jgi:hypothetical protein
VPRRTVVLRASRTTVGLRDAVPDARVLTDSPVGSVAAVTRAGEAGVGVPGVLEGTQEARGAWLRADASGPRIGKQRTAGANPGCDGAL